ncbi:MAG: NRDE family protein [Flavobacteriaceae bacterium]|nr:NRDE family protein [Flavobacteriaceae bacterium]NVJ71737.1 NRDE family protein [Flavobacteriaceae bacterium]
MCTLTYIPLKEHRLICSNRDEIAQRSQCELTRTDTGLIYPREPLKGGSWICSDNKRVLVLLNGAFKKHQPNSKYTKSRGLLLLELSETENPIQLLESMNLTNVEPFTLVLIETNTINEARWTGVELFCKSINPKEAHIWSSSSLYTEDAIKMRANLFKKYLESKELTKESQWFFHTQKSDDLENGIVMKRDLGPQTISTTQILFGDDLKEFKYFDHIKDELIQL